MPELLILIRISAYPRGLQKLGFRAGIVQAIAGGLVLH